MTAEGPQQAAPATQTPPQTAPAPRGAPVGTVMNTYAFSVYLKSDIASGNQLGQPVYVVEPDPITATTKVQSYYGTNIQSMVGPVLQASGVQL